MVSRILVLIDHYLPGYKAGGPVRSVANLVEQLGDEFEFFIVTRDREFGDLDPYPHVKVDQWQPVGKAQVMYLSPTSSSAWNWRKIFQMTDYDTLYLNSFFARWTMLALLLHRMGQIAPRKIVLAPRGEFSSGAIALKAQRKHFYITFQDILGLSRPVVWHATSDSEVQDIRREIPPRAWRNTEIWAINNLVSLPDNAYNSIRSRHKQPGEIRAAFLSRIAPKKNLDVALDLLRTARGSVRLDIYGPLEDQAYWERCTKIIAAMPKNVCVQYCGVVPPNKVAQVLSEYHLFFLPTRGENFGHAIYEALAAGCPVLVSDQTPWRNLQSHHAGWDLPLDKLALFGDVLDEFVAWDQTQFDNFSHGAWRYAREFAIEQMTALSEYRLLLRVD